MFVSIFLHIFPKEVNLRLVSVRGKLKQEPSERGFEYCFEYFKDKAQAHSLE